jgi:hypothetical protein
MTDYRMGMGGLTLTAGGMALAVVAPVEQVRIVAALMMAVGLCGAFLALFLADSI